MQQDPQLTCLLSCGNGDGSENDDQDDALGEQYARSLSTVRYGYFVSILVRISRPLLLFGRSGSGKTTIIRDVLTKKVQKNWLEFCRFGLDPEGEADSIRSNVIRMASSMDPDATHAVEDKMLSLHFDDVSLERVFTTSTQPSPMAEMIREMLDTSSLLSKDEIHHKLVVRTSCTILAHTRHMDIDEHVCFFLLLFRTFQ
jgi:hypothetical protein